MKNDKERIVSVTCVDKDGYFCAIPYDIWEKRNKVKEDKKKSGDKESE